MIYRNMNGCHVLGVNLSYQMTTIDSNSYVFLQAGAVNTNQITLTKDTYAILQSRRK